MDALRAFARLMSTTVIFLGDLPAGEYACNTANRSAFGFGSVASDLIADNSACDAANNRATV